MEFFEVVFSRTSVRSFNDRPLTSQEWDSLIRAAMAAPSAVNLQPWDFIIVEKRETLQRLAAELPYAKMTAQAGGAVLVCSTPNRANQGKEEYAVIDASAACENLLLAATALDLGAVWTAVYPNADRETAVRRILGIPAEVLPLALVPVGEPKGSQHPKDKYNKAMVHRERW
jgi:nitroreductase